MENIRVLQAYGYIIFTVFLVFIMYGYLYHLIKSEKKGTRNYEKYADLALHDDISDKPLETRSPSQKEKE